jgi:hypothetical protein
MISGILIEINCKVKFPYTSTWEYNKQQGITSDKPDFCSLQMLSVIVYFSPRHSKWHIAYANESKPNSNPNSDECECKCECERYKGYELLKKQKEKNTTFEIQYLLKREKSDGLSVRKA